MVFSIIFFPEISGYGPAISCIYCKPMLSSIEQELFLFFIVSAHSGTSNPLGRPLFPFDFHCWHLVDVCSLSAFLIDISFSQKYFIFYRNQSRLYFDSLSSRGSVFVAIPVLSNLIHHFLIIRWKMSETYENMTFILATICEFSLLVKWELQSVNAVYHLNGKNYL